MTAVAMHPSGAASPLGSLNDPAFTSTRDALASLRAVRGLSRPALLLRLRQSVLPCLRWVGGLPQHRAPQGDAAGEVLLRTYLADRSAGHGRLLALRAEAVLLLPSTEAEYLRGRSRQALRTGLNRARHVGLSCQELSTSMERDEALVAFRTSSGHPGGQQESFPAPDDQAYTWYACHDSVGQVVAIATLLQGGRWGLLTNLITAWSHEERYTARYALHTHIVRHLISKGGTDILLVTGAKPFFLRQGRVHFQHMLGYGLANLAV